MAQLSQERDQALAKIVSKAKDGDNSSKLQLLESFKWFLKKYKNLLTSGPINLAEKDIRQFISLYLNSKVRGLLLSNKLNRDSEQLVYQKVTELRNMCTELGELDIESIVDLTFFQCLSVYNEKGKVRKEARKHGIDYDSLSKKEKANWDKKFPPVGFEGFLLNYFKYLLKKNIDKETKGIIPGVGWCQPVSVDFPDVDEVVEEDSYNIDDMFKNNATFDNEWIIGKTCNWPFSELTQRERWLLKNRFEDRNYAVKLADMTGLSPTQIRKQINDIKAKLELLIIEK